MLKYRRVKIKWHLWITTIMQNMSVALTHNTSWNDFLGENFMTRLQFLLEFLLHTVYPCVNSHADTKFHALRLLPRKWQAQFGTLPSYNHDKSLPLECCKSTENGMADTWIIMSGLIEPSQRIRVNRQSLVAIIISSLKHAMLQKITNRMIQYTV